tara:strand:- start:48208 stop:48444 length:237 start_codon:yes stop_codon:yes gene_type:complete
MEQMQDTTQCLMDAWMASGGTVMASNVVKTMNDPALSAAAVTANTGGQCSVEVESIDPALSAAAVSTGHADFPCRAPM